MATKKEISDNVLYKLCGGVPVASFPVHERDIWTSMDAMVNAKYKLHYFDTTLPLGETIPENTMIGVYPTNTVTSTNNGKSYAIVPITPISLPKGMGIFLVYDANKPDVPFIPLQSSQLSLLKVDTLLNDLMGQIGYTPKKDNTTKSMVVEFTKDLTTFGISEVTMELAVFDMSQYSTTQDLPIPADMVDDIIDSLVAKFAPILAKSGIVSNFVNPTQMPTK